jgi:HlyD family secretion protein
MFGKYAKIFIYGVILICIGIFLYFFINDLNKPQQLNGIGVGNGRIETTQVDITTKLPGRLLDIYVNEGDIVQKTQKLVTLNTDELQAKLQEAIANVEQAKQNKNYTLSIVKQRESELALALKNYERAKKLYANKSISLLEFQENETKMQTSNAALLAAKSQVVSNEAAINAALARVETIKVNINESTLYSPIKGRVLYKIAQSGEMIASGGRVLVVLDLLDTYMTIFLPTSQAGLVNIGSEARIVLDAIPNVAIPAKVTFVSPQAQFTPKEIETQTEREKLMFRVKVKIDSKLLEKYFNKIKTGLPGVAYVKLDEDAIWPESLNNLPKDFNQNSGN